MPQVRGFGWSFCAGDGARVAFRSLSESEPKTYYQAPVFTELRVLGFPFD